MITITIITITMIMIIIVIISIYLVDEQCISGLIGGATDIKVSPTSCQVKPEANLRRYCTLEDAATKKCYSVTYSVGEAILVISMLMLIY